VQRSVLVFVVVLASAGAWFGALKAATALRGVVDELDRAEELAALQPRAQATIVFDRHGQPAFSYFVEQRIDVPLASVSPHMVDALLAIEDRRFYQHNGVDPIRVVAAAWRNIRAKRIVQGASTITQQLARVSQLTPERTYVRKMREVMIATRLEQRYSKDEILAQYLNTIYFGEGLYGIEAASRGYFAKPASGLALHEAALLAALVRSPSHDAPRYAPQRALARRNLVLRLMHRRGMIDAAQLAHALGQALPDRSHRRNAGMLASARGTGLYFQEELRRQLVAQFGDERVLRGGLRVYSTFDPTMQRAAEDAVAKRIGRIVRSRPRARDLQGGLVALDPTTGDVLALVGGRNFDESSFNRATQARRQPGSAFKPIFFAAALERGYGPGSLLRDLDTPIAASGGAWLPSGDHERPEYTVRRALRVSSNRAAAQLLQQIGVSTAIYYAQRLGIESRLPIVPSLALGTGEVTLLELTTAYTAFANQGIVSSPRLLTHVTDAQGNLLWEVAQRHRQALSPTTAYLMSNMLADVVLRGTGSPARAAGFRLPAAGKTGTTDDFMDAWFIGYTPHLVAGVWFGFDRPEMIMRDGFAGTVAAPAWGEFMRVATAGARPDWYEMPGDVETVAICRLSGARATDACRHGTPASDTFAMQTASVTTSPDGAALQPVAPLPPSEPTVYEDLFPIGAVPIETCAMHAASPAVAGGDVPSPGNETPLVNVVLRSRQTTPVSGVPTYAPSIVETSNGTRISIQRIVGADGVTRTVVRQIR
jgi:1A family penicillin-binding protein